MMRLVVFVAIGVMGLIVVRLAAAEGASGDHAGRTVSRG